MLSTLIDKIDQRTATVGVIGLGYTGLPLLIELYNQRFSVIGMDVDSKKITALKKGETYLHEISKEHVGNMALSNKVSYSTGLDSLSKADIVIICVPTPLDDRGIPNLRYIREAAVGIARHMHPGILVILESTTYPGTTQEILKPELERQGFTIGTDYLLAFSPERMNPGELNKFRLVPRVVGGVTSTSTQGACAFYRTVFDTVYPVTSAETAEMCKLLENSFRNVNIGLVNELANLCNKMNINVWEVIHAASTKPYGFMPFYPGPGIGGHCIPVDPVYLTWKAKELGSPMKIIEQSIQSQEERVAFIIDKIARTARAAHSRKPSLLMLGVSFKPNVEDLRGSPILTILNQLHRRKIDVKYHDPYVPEIELNSTRLFSVQDLDKEMKMSDIVVIGTDHSSYEWENICSQAKKVIDLRGVTQGLEMPNIIRL